MAAMTQNIRTNTVQITFTKKRDALIEKLMPRRCMAVSIGMILAGVGIPTLMACKVLPLSLLLGFAGFALVAVGGVLALIYCGEL